MSVNNELIQPLTHVMVMKKCDVSGSTLGYHGTVIRHVDRSVLSNSDRQSEWTYRVYIPVLNAQFEIASERIIATEESDSFDSIRNVGSEIQFDTEPEDSSSSQLISGAIRLNESDWLHFYFKKHEDNSDRYQFSMPMDTHAPICKRLHYFVAIGTPLDRGFVLRTLPSILGKVSNA